ncbi:BLUF domain-containing protein [Epibacterium ulvae]|uniref:BLUF domain-containing protein n=1 Tax=Epibacterium ulvae TaxID=1156985 RepID=UPI001BFCC63C|nr:BLUF domain-containing protein [Epibacterium ulvae]MBT8153742.1 BLUF domain-containing protein [Epibacterium ulvae]
MHRLIYLSQTTRPMSSLETGRLIAKAQARNAKAGLTGMLVLLQSRFLQVLEGPENALAQCYGRIQQDKRHSHMQLLQSTPITQRAFPDWKMSLFHPEQLPEQAKDAALSIDALIPMNSPDRGDDPEVRAVVRQFLASFKRMAAA